MSKPDSPLDDLESRMRVQFGIASSDPTRPATVKPQQPAPRTHGAASPPRHRFVKDGEVPTTVMANGSKDNQLVSIKLRLEEVTRKLAAETALRQELERRLGEEGAKLQSLQTRNRSLELARDEAVTAALAAAPPAAVAAAPRRGRPPEAAARKATPRKPEASDRQVPVKWWQGG